MPFELEKPPQDLSLSSEDQRKQTRTHAVNLNSEFEQIIKTPYHEGNEAIRPLEQENPRKKDEINRFGREETAVDDSLEEMFKYFNTMGVDTPMGEDENEDENNEKGLYPPIVHSPGVQFVAELSELLDLDPGHHALIADIMDRQFAKSMHSTPTSST